MTNPSSDRPNLSRDEEAFVRKLADSYVAPELSPNERAAFHVALEQRLARRRAVQHWRPVLAGGAVAAALAVLVLARGGDVAPPAAENQRVVARKSSTTAEGVILAMATESPSEQEAELPEDYLAIEDVLLGE
jgi:anti-sigma factor RsiW